MTIDMRTTTRPRHNSSAAAYTDWSGRVQAHTRPALSQDSQHGNGGGRCGGCEPSSGVVDELLVLLLLWAWVLILPYYVNGESTRFSPLAEHALHPDPVAVRLRSKQRPRAARAEAARAGRWWPWLDSNGVTFFVQQYDRGTCCRLQRQQYELLLYKYLIPGAWYVVGVVSVSYFIRQKWNACFLAAHKILHSCKEVQKWSHKQKGQKGSFVEPKKILHNKRPKSLTKQKWKKANGECKQASIIILFSLRRIPKCA